MSIESERDPRKIFDKIVDILRKCALTKTTPFILDLTALRPSGPGDDEWTAFYTELFRLYDALTDW
jgi:hypothetical protein